MDFMSRVYLPLTELLRRLGLGEHDVVYVRLESVAARGFRPALRLVQAPTLKKGKNVEIKTLKI